MGGVKHVLEVLGPALMMSLAAVGQTIPAPLGRVDLNGFWESQPFTNNFGQQVKAGLKIVQHGDNVTVTMNMSGMPKRLVFEGHFDTETVIKGKAPGLSGSPDKATWVPDVFAVTDGTHLKNHGMALVKVGGLETAQLEKGTAANTPTKPYLPPEKLLNLNGSWQSTQHDGPLYRIGLVQKGAEITMTQAAGGVFFRGTYTTNPTISGKGIPRTSSLKDPVWVDESIFVEDPDHIRINTGNEAFPLYRFSNPAAHDLICDAGNTFHVARLHAWIRGRMANAEHDFPSAKCWLTIGANAGYAPAQSLLAALLVQQPTVSAADYLAVFQLAGKSAEQDNVAGELLLASLYREGKGTPKDLQKAQLWTQRAQQSKIAAQWKLMNTDVFMGLTPLQIAGLAIHAAEVSVTTSDEKSDIVCPGQPNNHTGNCH